MTQTESAIEYLRRQLQPAIIRTEADGTEVEQFAPFVGPLKRRELEVILTELVIWRGEREGGKNLRAWIVELTKRVELLEEAQRMREGEL